MLRLVDIGYVPALGGKGCNIHLSESVAFEVTLVHYPQPKFVREIIKSRIVDLVGCADGIYIVGFHKEEIFDEKVVGHSTTVIRVVLVAVHTPELDRLSIDQKDPIFQLRVTEPHSLLNCAV
jgi:hypothetical protein